MCWLIRRQLPPSLGFEEQTGGMLCNVVPLYVCTYVHAIHSQAP